MAERILIFDTTLRDGEQSPGASMNIEEKLRIARQLERLRVDVIEAGFPIASVGDFESVREVARHVRECSIAGLARARFEDIDRAWEALSGAADPRIHTFIATSPIHRRHKLGMDQDQVLEAAVAAVRRAVRYTANVEWSAEDAGRTELEFLSRIVEAVIAAGARTVNIPDTVGYTLPEEFGARIAWLMNHVDNIHEAVISVHCHNDLGLAVANSLAAVAHGARQVECTINGLGERAGNAALEEVVMALRTRHDHPAFNALETRIETTEIIRTSKLVSAITGFPVQPNKAIVGANAFAHESGIHQDGVLKEVTTYEIMTPESVGLATNRMVLGKHSGRHAFKERLKELGYELDDQQLDRSFRRFKGLADMKQELFDEDIRALVDDEVIREDDHYRLVKLHVVSGMQDTPMAAVGIQAGSETILEATRSGVGPIDAVFQAIHHLIPEAGEARLNLYQVSAVTGGLDAQAVVTVRLEQGARLVQGQGADNDVIVASARAFINALNKLVCRDHLPHNGV
ncbi:MAG: 2-isopropylmalate synthase [Magnetococcales bacterium]|nr:2-isopropylmalate synthase [Magnetococcales bacterium]MBF0150427.1 2-isopropylmalate synthase [Magnetococcales bacterium]MBF0346801.1 2-isopropylmalate synthase [Magnetococcales bacterium]MBF0630945.1 2-isopropylmalate synthase [Magnetococcales bacterium]